MNKKLFEDIGKRVKKRRIELGYFVKFSKLLPTI